MKITGLTSLAICLIGCRALAQSPGYATSLPGDPYWDSGFDGHQALLHVRVLASDSLRGRYSGFAGSDKADRYIGGHFASLGLAKPFGKDGYSHRFAYGAGEYAMPSGLVIHRADGNADTAHMWRDLNVFKYSGFGQVRGRVIWVGYGVSAPDKGWDDYAGLDVKGAVVIAMRGVPPLEGVRWKDEFASGFKSTTALAKGAVGFIYCENDPPKLATIMEEYYRENLPAAWVSKSFADSILKSSGRTKNEWKKLIDSTKTPASRRLDVEAELQVSGKYYPRRKTDNIAAILPGSDPALAQELVLIGAHMDHHGVDAAGNIYPGADDNASGTATMMELSRVFAARPERPKRSLMFIGFAAEEEGLVGSKAFVKSLPLRGYDVVAMLNMDMVGQGNCSLGVGGIDEFPLLGDAYFSTWPDSALKPLEFWGLYPGSDHASFADAGIPSYVIGARGDHPNYHTPGDSAGNIKPEVMKACGDMMFHCALALAEYPQPIKPMVGRGFQLANKFGGVRLWNLSNSSHSFGDSIEPYWTSHRGFSPSFRSPRSATINYTPWFELAITPVPIEEQDPFKLTVWKIELVHEATDWEAIVWQADSVRADWKGKLFRGMTLATSEDVVPGSPISTLMRLGLGFVLIHPHQSNDRPVDKSRIENLAACRSKGLRAVVRIDRGWWNTATQTALQAAAADWHGQIVCFVSDTSFTSADAQKLAEAGLFVQLWLGDDGTMCRKWSKWLKDEANASRGKHYGVAPEPAMIEALLAAGFDEDQVGDLLINNLVRILQRWREEKTATSVGVE